MKAFHQFEAAGVASMRGLPIHSRSSTARHIFRRQGAFLSCAAIDADADGAAIGALPRRNRFFNPLARQYCRLMRMHGPPFSAASILRVCNEMNYATSGH